MLITSLTGLQARRAAVAAASPEIHACAKWQVNGTSKSGKNTLEDLHQA